MKFIRKYKIFLRSCIYESISDKKKRINRCIFFNNIGPEIFMDIDVADGGESRPPARCGKVAVSIYRYFPFGGLQKIMMDTVLELQRRNFDVTGQEITENTYANYRYYPESLSAMLLPENYANGILKMRDNLGSYTSN